MRAQGSHFHKNTDAYIIQILNSMSFYLLPWTLEMLQQKSVMPKKSPLSLNNSLINSEVFHISQKTITRSPNSSYSELDQIFFFSGFLSTGK